MIEKQWELLGIPMPFTRKKVPLGTQWVLYTPTHAEVIDVVSGCEIRAGTIGPYPELIYKGRDIDFIRRRRLRFFVEHVQYRKG